nr:unnamed protein product [Spirometra erinaceieuropaei]
MWLSTESANSHVLVTDPGTRAGTSPQNPLGSDRRRVRAASESLGDLELAHQNERHFHSNHPVTHKRCCVKTLSKRIQAHCSKSAERARTPMPALLRTRLLWVVLIGASFLVLQLVYLNYFYNIDRTGEYSMRHQRSGLGGINIPTARLPDVPPVGASFPLDKPVFPKVIPVIVLACNRPTRSHPISCLRLSWL